MSLGGSRAQETLWFLEDFPGAGRERVRTPVRPLPFRIGRRPDLGLTISSPSVSGEHAEIYVEGEALWLRDLGSTNGTFLNRQRLAQPMKLENGDILHFADRELRLVQEAPSLLVAGSGTLQLPAMDLSRLLGASGREIGTLLDKRAVLPLFQPIVALNSRKIMGYETLCRGTWPSLPPDPPSLFIAAAVVGRERELSQLFREVATEAVADGAGANKYVFLNTHPVELASPEALLLSLLALCARLGPTRPQLVLEIHESAVTDLGAMRELSVGLKELEIGLAYDDFGAGQARLLELVEVPPAFLKFDISLIRKLHAASAGRQRMLTVLVRMAQELGIRTLAEGIEMEEEAIAATGTGFELAQGFLFGRPAPLP